MSCARIWLLLEEFKQRQLKNQIDILRSIPDRSPEESTRLFVCFIEQNQHNCTSTIEKEMLKLIDEGADLTARTVMGKNCLMMWKISFQFVEEILSRGGMCLIDTIDQYGSSPVSLTNDLGIARLLLSYGVNVSSSGMIRAFNMYKKHGMTEFMELFIEHGYDESLRLLATED